MMKQLRARKTLVACLLIGVLCIAVAAVFLVGMLHQKELEQFRNEALEELERDVGQYDDQSIVLYQTSKAQAEELAALIGADLRITEDGRFAKLTLAEGTTIRDVYANDDMLEHIEKMSADYQVRVSELTEEAEDEAGERLPTRPQYSVSDTDYELQTYLDYLNMKNVWGSYRGEGVTVAVIDTGIDTDHPEFAGRISEYSYNATEDKIVKDWLTEDGEYDWSLIEDEVGHGTAVTGVLAASMNGDGVVGIAPKVNIIVIKAECTESGTFKRTSDLVFGLYYAIERDVGVVNMSFGISMYNPFAEATQLAYDSDIVCVAAAGNEGTSGLTYPAADEYVIGVGALEADSWELASYSNYGENTNLVAPGTTYTTLTDGSYGVMNGTSLASPVVAGAVALFMQNNPYIMVDDVTEVLYASSTDLGDLGRDWKYGFGALDMSAFLLEERGTITFDMLTDELDNTEEVFVKGHTLQELPEPERLYAVFDGWYYDDTFTQEYTYYEDKFYNNITLYAKWVNEDDGVPFTYVELEDGTIEIRSYTGKRRFITIPEKIDGKVVSSIGESAFAGQTRLREVGLPSGLKQIRRSAFEGCSNLVWIEIPENVLLIGETAFADNTRLSSIAFLGNSKLETVGDYAFSNCGKLESIELPASLKSINATAFYGDLALHTIKVQAGNEHFIAPDGVLYNRDQSVLVVYPVSHGSTYTLHQNTREIAMYAFAFAQLNTINLDAVESIGSYAFFSSELESLIIPDCATNMGEGVFALNLNLSYVSIGNGLSELTKNVFKECISLKSITIPRGIHSIGAAAFIDTGLTRIIFEESSTLIVIEKEAFSRCRVSELDIPASVVQIGQEAFFRNPLVRVGFAQNSSLQFIGDSAFESCKLLEQIDLPSGLETIGGFAFRSTALSSISIPASVTSLGDGAFAYCSNLPAIEIEEGNAVYHDLDGIVYSLDNVTIYAYPAGKTLQIYSLETTTRAIMPYSFAGTVYLQHVTVPEGLSVIGENAFCSCGASTYSLPSTLTNIMGYAFYDNTKLDWINFPDALVQIAEYAFSKCSSLYSVHIPDNVLQIGRYAFAEDWRLYSVMFNATSNLPRIGYGAFAYTGLQGFTVPANVSTIAQEVFYGCRNLASVTFAENSKLESISAYMFDGCTNLQNINFMQGSALTSIQAHGLEGMTRLRSLDLTNTKLTNIDNFAFRFCENLNSLTLPDTVRNVGRYAFYACESLSEFSLPEAVEHIGSYAFLGTNELDLYLASESMPVYLDENWDHGIRGYYTGVSSVVEDGDYKYAVLTSGNIAIIEYLGIETTVDLTTVDFGAPIITIGGSAFKDGTVTQIVLPETLTTIQAEAFQYTALESVTIPASVTFIGREAFAHTDIQTLTFANGSMLNVIEQYAFEGTENLTSVTLPKSVTTLGTGVFQKSGLTSVTFEQGINLKEIPQNAFLGTKLTTVKLPDSVETVNHNAFRDILTLKTVDFGNSDGIRLLSNVFYNTGLETLHIPATVTFIGEYCFVGLETLAEITVDANNPNYVSNDGLLLTKSGRKLVTVPAGRTGTLTVPLSVEEIGFGAFEKTALDEIIFDKNANILTFGYRAFFGAKNLTELHVPASVVSIDYYAFAYCEKLQTVTFAEGNKLKGIYEGAFCGDINLENITIPDSIVEISDFAFYGCTKIDKLPLGKNNAVKGIYDYAFAYTSIGGDFTTPETLVDIGAYAFLGTDITKLTIPDTNKKDLIIGIGAFEECNKLTEVTLPFIGASFEDDEISWFGYIFGAGAYEANQTYVPASLKTVTITDGITFVGISGFAECASLETINVPHSVSVLWNDAFRDTTARYELTNDITTCWLEYGWVYFEAREGHFGKGITGFVSIADGVTAICDSAFGSCGSLTNVAIPESVASIGSSAFSGCGGLTSIEIPTSVTVIESHAFSSCSSLTSVIIPESVTSIGWFAFSGCSNLTSVEIPSGITAIENFAFFECSSLTSITIPESVAVIGSSAFSCCGSLSCVEIPDSITSIDSFAFSGCQNLSTVKIRSLDSWCKIDFEEERSNPLRYGASLCIDETLTNELVIPDSVSEIKPYAFCGSGLKSVIIPDSVTSIGTFAFSGCSDVKSVTIPKNVTSIGSYAFYRCSNLSSLELSNGVNEIGVCAFMECTDLKKLTIPDSVTSIGEGAFRECKELFSVSLGSGVNEIGNSAFSECNIVSVENNSNLEIGFDSKHGYIAYRALIIFDAFGNTMYRDDGTEYLLTEDQFLFAVEKDGYNQPIYRLIAYSGQEETITLPLSVNGHAYVISNFRGATQVVIPNGVTHIEDYAFNGCSSLISVEIPKSVTSIGWSAFDGCSSLTSVTLQEGLVSIGDSAFSDCSSLTSIEIPESVTSIGCDAFSGCSSLTSIEIPEKVTSIEWNTFSGCTSLTSIEIPKNVTSIELDAFDGCRNLAQITIPESVTLIGGNAFRGCINLVYIEIPGGVTSIGSGAFYGCDNLSELIITGDIPDIGGHAFPNCTTITFAQIDKYLIIDGVVYSSDLSNILYVSPGVTAISIPEGLTSIGAYAFSGCDSLTSVIVPDSVISIGAYAFSGCDSLTSVIVPDSVISIEAFAFSECIGLTSISLPNGLKSIGASAFSGCSSLANINIPNGVTTIESDTFRNCSRLTSLVIPEGVTSIEWGAFRWCSNLTNIELPNSVTYIGGAAFESCGSLTSIELPNALTSIGYSVFNGCSSLTSIDIEENITSIDYYAFSGCSSLTSIKIPDSVTRIGDNAFNGCSGLKSITIPESVTSIGYGVFSGCSSLTGILIPDSVTSIDASAFSYCSSMTSIVIPKSVTSIGGGLFSHCDSLTSIEIPEGVTSIEGGTFLYCSSLTNIKLPDAVTSIGPNAFEGCSSLTSIEIPEGVTAIEYDTFRNCSSLESFLIPDGVTSIERGAFSGCSSLRHITIPKEVRSIENGTFSGCSGLTSIVIPDGVTMIDGSAFEGCSSLSNVTIPESVTTINQTAFLGCSSLTNITIPKGVTSIGDWAFNNCCILVIYNNSSIPIDFGTENGEIASNALMIVDANGNVKYPEQNGDDFECIVTSDQFLFTKQDSEYTLRGYLGTETTVALPLDIFGSSYLIRMNSGVIKHLIIPEGFTEVGDEAFKNCNGLISVVIPDGVTSIGGNAFSGCSSLTNIEIPESVTYIGSVAFSGCGSLESIKIPEGMTLINSNAFSECGSLTSIVIPDSVTSINKSAFSGCSGLTSISIPENVTYIGSNAFSGCSGLTNVTIPENVTYIGSHAFHGCLGLYNNSMYCKNGYLLIDGCLLSLDQNTKYLPDISSIRVVADGVYDGCYLLKNSIDRIDTPNVETLLICNFNGYEIYSNINVLKDVVITDRVDIADFKNNSNLFGMISGITIFVESLEEDLRWDDNFPGWNNGNRVYYGDEWSWVHFYDENGIILYSEPRPNSAIVRRPVYEPQSDAQFTAELIGWDLDGDGVADSLPATTTTDLHAVSVVERTLNKYNVTFIDSQTEEIYSQQTLPYGAVIELPDAPSKEGLIFERWEGYEDGITVTGDITFTAKWHEHTITSYNAKAPNCTEIGWNAYETCSRCNYTTYAELPALGHSYAAAVTAPTCTTEGYTTHTCTVCGDSYTDNVTDATGHAMGEWYTVTAPTCTTTGTEQRDCSNCNHSETRIAATLGHDLITHNAKAPNCTEIGWNAYETCSRCDYSTYAELPALGHSYTAAVTAPTCTTEGYTTHTCTVCGDSYTDNITYATGHAMGEWYTVIAPTCTERGTAQRDCANCDRFEINSVDALGHNLITHNAKAPACTEIGWDAYETCSRCDYTTYAELPATGHTETTILVNPTCTEDGYRAVHCATCYKELSHEVLPATGHDYVDGICAVCGEINFIYGDANGDGRVNGMDATRLLGYLANLDPFTGLSSKEIAYGADVNGDGRIDSRDVTRLLRYLANVDPLTGESTVTLGPKK